MLSIENAVSHRLWPWMESPSKKETEIKIGLVSLEITNIGGRVVTKRDTVLILSSKKLDLTYPIVVINRNFD